VAQAVEYLLCELEAPSSNPSPTKEKKRVTEGMNMIKVHYIHVWKYHNKTPLYNFLLAVLEFELRALHLLGRHFYHLNLFCDGFF
jgi:hypothetical protein